MKGNDWIRCLTEVEKDNFLRNLLDHRHNGFGFFLDEQFPSFTDFISGAFTWSDTPEGWDYWRMISLRNPVFPSNRYRMDRFKFV